MANMFPLVLLHGWGFDRRIWQNILPELQTFTEVITIDLPCFGESTLCNSDIDDVSVYLLEQLPPRCVLLGWSLGGMIATHLAIHYPERVAGLMTVASNLKWVSDAAFENREWPGASPDDFASFFENLATQTEATKNYFCGVIARGDKQEKNIAKLLRQQLSKAPVENFLSGLRLLDSIDNRTNFKQLVMPGLHLFGEQDALVSLNVEVVMRSLNKNQQTYVLSGLSHAPFLSDPELFLRLVKKFMQSHAYPLNKQRVAQSFSKAAISYDAASQLQREVGDLLFLRLCQLCASGMESRAVLDLGCGTGAYSQKLVDHFPSTQIVSLDIAAGMLQVAKQKNNKIVCVCADAEHLPFKDHSIDVIFSNLAIQWCQDYRQFFSELQRVLAPGGHCFISTFQQGTLRELKDAWQIVDDYVHVNEFAYAENLREIAVRVGLFSIDMQHQSLVKYYDQVKQLTQELKAIGAHNINDGRPVGLTGKRKLKKLLDAYDLSRCDDKLPAHYEIVYLTLTKELQHG